MTKKTKNVLIGVAIASAVALIAGLVAYNRNKKPKTAVEEKINTLGYKMDEKLYQQSGIATGAGTPGELIAFRSGTKYYSYLQPQCVTQPCEPVIKEISQVEWNNLKSRPPLG